MITDDDSSLTDSQTPADDKHSKRHIATHRTLAVLPTLCTLANGLCGFLAIFFASRIPENAQLLWHWTPLTTGAIFIFMGMFFDTLDGRLARLTRHTSNLGEQLDSMSDMVTFGVAPAYLVVQLVAVEIPFLSEQKDHIFDRIALAIACIYVACAALRLARFNLNVKSNLTTDHMSFEGLPTPGAAGTVASLVLLHQHLLANELANESGDNRWITIASIAMVAITLLTALTMVSRLRYIHLANRYLRERAPIQYIAIIVAIALLAPILLQEALATGFILYALSAPTLRLAGTIPFRSRP